MNQKEESNDSLTENKDNSLGLSEMQIGSDGEEDLTPPPPAPAQIVEDISASPAEVIESAFPEEKSEESAEQSEETPETLQTAEAPPAVSPPETSETGTFQLVNAMVDRPYKTEINLKELKIENAKFDSDFAEQVEKLGLTARRDGDIFQIEGTPTADSQGEHNLCLDYNYEGEDRIQRKKFILLINPDPKTLWKNLEPDADLLYRKDHQATELVLSKNFKIAAASRRGRSHAHEGKFREDDFAIQSGENGWHILIVADGAGSAALSREGSRLACRTAMESVEKSIAELLGSKFDLSIGEFAGGANETSHKEIKNLLYQVLCGAAFAAYKRLEQESTTTGNALKDYSTTFLISIFKEFAQGYFIASFGIGDGAIGVYTKSSGSIELMNSPDGGEFSGQTRFLTMREVIGDGNEMLRRVKFKLFNKFTFLALMTDGISDPKFGTDNNLVSFEKWREFVDELSAKINFDHTNDKTAEQILDYMDFWSPGEHDDRTLAILY